jgi:hypothetical protein
MKRVKFLKVTTVEIVLNDPPAEPELFPLERTFHYREIIFVNNIEEIVKGFLDMEFPNGDVAIGIPSGSVEITDA